MPSDPILNFDELLAPVSPENPGGDELKSNPNPELHNAYQVVADARTAATKAERDMFLALAIGDEMHEIEPPDWKAVERLAKETIARKSKDLWMAAWLTEAMVRLHGFPGLRDGLHLSRRLCEEFWEHIHPSPDEEEGYEPTVSPWRGLLGAEGTPLLTGAIEQAPITSYESLSSEHYRQAQSLEEETDPDKRRAREEKGEVTRAQFINAVKVSGTEFYDTLLEDIDACKEELQAFTAFLDEHCDTEPGRQPVAPSAAKIYEVLEECQDRVKRIMAEVFGDVAPPRQEGGPPPAPGAVGAGAAPIAVPTGAIGTREEAFLLLQRVADYFRAHEPQSILSYSLELAIRRGKMPLPDLMAELISDEGARHEFSRLTGVPGGRADEES